MAFAVMRDWPNYIRINHDVSLKMRTTYHKDLRCLTILFKEGSIISYIEGQVSSKMCRMFGLGINVTECGIKHCSLSLVFCSFTIGVNL